MREQHGGAERACEPRSEESIHLVFAEGDHDRVGGLFAAAAQTRCHGVGAVGFERLDQRLVGLHSRGEHGEHAFLRRLAAGVSAQDTVGLAHVMGGAEHAHMALFDPDGLVA